MRGQRKGFGGTIPHFSHVSLGAGELLLSNCLSRSICVQFMQDFGSGSFRRTSIAADRQLSPRRERERERERNCII